MMKRTWLITIGALGLATACNAGYLHRAYQGEFCAHGHKYVVDNDGKIELQTKENSMEEGYIGCRQAGKGDDECREKTWTTDISFSDLKDLDNVIGDLQKLSKDLHDVYGPDGYDEGDSNCDKEPCK